MIALALMLEIATGTAAESRATPRIAGLIEREARARVLPVDVMVAVAWVESRFDHRAAGRGGDTGLMQVRPQGMASILCKRLVHRLRAPWANVRCAARILAHARWKCGPDPRNYLSFYNGRRCGPSSYSRRVLAVLKR